MQTTPPDDTFPARYVVGVDLGTTNSAVSFVDTTEEPWKIRTFPVSQLVEAGQVERRDTLPSFHYEPAPGEFPPKALRLPWHNQDPDHIVGVFAREHGRLVPGRLIDSAKSWLSHPGVDRTGPLLPWQGAADVERLSPVEVSARYLTHVREAWDAEHRGDPLAEQDLVLTLPASFDEVARELTVEAAKRAGLRRVVLIEEPQAAFYSWIDAHRDDWEQHVSPGQKILVCDIGGGTSDFTLIRVRRQESGEIQFHRVAVGEHLILGGDNFDLALAHHLERRLAGDGKLEPRQWSVLVRTCRHVKETLLGPNPPEKVTVALPGTGAKLIGGGLNVEVTGEEAQQLVVEGFFPGVDLDARPTRRQSGFQEFGLPYAADPAITRHLAAFLTAHRDVALEGDERTSSAGTAGQSSSAGTAGLSPTAGTAGLYSSAVPADGGYSPTVPVEGQRRADPARPDIVLFNGGIFGSPALRSRLLDVLASWFRDEQADWRPLVLQNERLDLAVARGAAYYGMVRRGEGVRIAAGLARTYYVEVEADPPSALCLVPAGVEPGHEVDLSTRDFELSLLEPVEFPLYISSTRLTDKPGQLVPIDREQMTPLPPIRTVLRSKKRKEAATVKVNLHARLTEIGTLELWCSEVDGPRSWQLQFDVRSATQTDIEAHEGLAEQEGVLERETVETCRRSIFAVFGEDGTEKPGGLPSRIAAEIEMSREDWPMTLLRQIWEALMEVEPGRRKTADHEARWLNLLGFSLRPGYGLAVDDWRVAQTWRTVQGKLAHTKPMCRTESWILWRRIAGGLSAGQQEALASPLLGLIRKKHQQMTTGRGPGADLAASSHEEAEIWRMLGSFERLPPKAKIELGRILLDLMPKRKMESSRPAMAWALGRVAARVPVYGPLNGVIPAELAAKWVKRFVEIDFDDAMGQLTLVQMTRLTGDRYRDVSQEVRDLAHKWLQEHSAPEHYLALVQTGGTLESEEQTLIVGEALPRGLRIL